MPEREPKGWYCGCGWPNGINLAVCSQCGRSPNLSDQTGCPCAIIYGEQDAPMTTRPTREPQEDGPDLQLLAWAVSNCHTLARRELNRLRHYANPDTLAIERWEHVQRICEKAGARSQGVLRASVPTEITDGGSAVPRPPEEQ